MAVMFDLMCNNPDCDYEEIDVMVETDVDDYGLCAVCGKGRIVRKVPGRMVFELKYDPKKDIVDWNGNTTQMWKKVNEARAQGKKVEIPERFRKKWY